MGTARTLVPLKSEAEEAPNRLRVLRANNLKRIREERGLKQKDIASIVGDTENHISDMERGIRVVSDRVAAILCEALKIEPFEFFVDEGTPVIEDGAELEVIHLFREAKGLHVSNQGTQFLRFLVESGRKDRTDAGNCVGGSANHTNLRPV